MSNETRRWSYFGVITGGLFGCFTLSSIVKFKKDEMRENTVSCTEDDEELNEEENDWKAAYNISDIPRYFELSEYNTILRNYLNPYGYRRTNNRIPVIKLSKTNNVCVTCPRLRNIGITYGAAPVSDLFNTQWFSDTGDNIYYSFYAISYDYENNEFTISLIRSRERTADWIHIVPSTRNDGTKDYRWHQYNELTNNPIIEERIGDRFMGYVSAPIHFIRTWDPMYLILNRRQLFALSQAYDDISRGQYSNRDPNNERYAYKEYKDIIRIIALRTETTTDDEN